MISEDPEGKPNVISNCFLCLKKLIEYTELFFSVSTETINPLLVEDNNISQYTDTKFSSMSYFAKCKTYVNVNSILNAPLALSWTEKVSVSINELVHKLKVCMGICYLVTSFQIKLISLCSNT